MITVVSKLSNDQKYTVYKSVPGGGYAVKGFVLIKGGANVTDRRTLQSADGGVFTQITPAQYEVLKQCPQFAAHVKAGYVYVSKSESDVESEKEAKKAAADLKEKDGSAQLTPKDFKKAGKRAPSAKAGK